MVLFEPEWLLLALVLIVPGFIAAFLGVTLGVVEQRISNAKWVIVSLVSSLIIVSVFVAILEFLGPEVTSPEEISYVFFEPSFRIEYIALLTLLSVILGVIYAGLLARNVHSKFRNLIWAGTDRRRNPWQPWEGALKDAHAVQVLTKDNKVVAGELEEYSRAGNDREIVLRRADWYDPEKDNRDTPEPEIPKEVLLEDDIKRVSILMTEAQAKAHNEAKQVEDDEESGEGGDLEAEEL